MGHVWFFVTYTGVVLSVVRKKIVFNKRKQMGKVNIGPPFSVKIKLTSCIILKFLLKKASHL